MRECERKDKCATRTRSEEPEWMPVGQLRRNFKTIGRRAKGRERRGMWIALGKEGRE